jgi:dTDP-4-amino-4,6-dideoxygalactose transaminase
MYHERLQHTRLRVPWAREPDAHVYHLYVVQRPGRDRFRSALAARGVETMIHYPYLLHQQPLFRRGEQPALPMAERVATRILSLPLYPQLKMEELQAVTDAILDCEA